MLHNPSRFATLTATGAGGAAPAGGAAYDDCTDHLVELWEAADTHVELARKDCTGTKEGVALFLPGSAGKDWFGDTINVETWLDADIVPRLEVIQTKWLITGAMESHNNGNQGYIHLTGRIAGMIKQIRDDRITGGQKLIVVAASAGCSALCHCLAHHRISSLIDRVILTGGPPHVHLVRGCNGTEPTYNYDVGQAGEVDDAWDRDPAAGPCELNTVSFELQWLAHSILTGQLYGWPPTSYAWGDDDTTVAPAQARLLADQQPNALRAYVHGTAHGVQGSDKGREVIGNLIFDRAFVRQSASFFDSSDTELAFTLPEPVKPGNALVVIHRAGTAFANLTAPSGFAVADDGVTQATVAQGSTSLTGWVKLDAAGGEETGLQVESVAATLHAIHVFEVEREGISGWEVDLVDLTLNAAGISGLTCGPTGTPTAAKEWFVAAAGTSGNHGGSPTEPTDGFTQQFSTSTDRLLTATKSTDTATAQETDLDWANTLNAAGLILGLKAA